jgi:hypothetical protein
LGVYSKVDSDINLVFVQINMVESNYEKIISKMNKDLTYIQKEGKIEYKLLLDPYSTLFNRTF